VALAPAADRAAFFRHLRHELRTPINHVVGYSELLLEGADDLSPEARGALVPDLQRIDAAGKELLSLVNTIFDASNVDAEIDLHQACHALRIPLNAVIGYSALLQEEAAEAGAEALLPDITRIHDAGTHLLTLVQAFLDLSPAALDAAAPPPSAGPRTLVADSGEPREPAPTASAPQTGRLLVVDDDSLNRDMLSRRLVRQGHRVALAESGERSLELLRAESFDLVLLDVRMPGLDGYEVLAAMKADAALRHLPVIVLSASDDEAGVIRCIELGAEDYVQKPFDPVLLRARIGACLEKKRLRDQEVDYRRTIEAQAALLAEWNRTLERRVEEQVAEIERINRLRRFLSPQVAKVIVSAGGEQLLESHRGHVVVCFCDLRGFTAFSDTASAEEIMRLLREYHATLGELIHEFEGTLEHFAGDGIMVFFNDPIPCADPEVRAVRMAVAMRERVAALAERWLARGHALGFGVGIASGAATMGRIGFEGRFDYAAIGPVTITAARLSGEARGGQILVSQRVHAAVDGLAECEQLPDVSLKGFARPVPVYNVTALRQPD
jgi:class 3 adenylate cyclase/CheY-like chemotaxis protein